MTHVPVTGSQLLVAASRRLSAAGIEDAGRDARRLLSHALGVAPARLTLVLPDPVAPSDARTFEALVGRRAAREPVSHLVGERAFYGRSFKVSADVLDPRPETETLVVAALGEAFERVLDLGTGSGCILLTLLAERPEAEGIGTDLSEAALAVAAENRARLGIGTRAALHAGDWFSALPQAAARFDLIASNPPYIALCEMEGLAPEVIGHEPHLALTDGGDGLGAYRRIVADAPRHLVPGGRLMLEIGPTQGKAVGALCTHAGLGEVQTLRDLDGRDRVVCARLIMS